MPNTLAPNLRNFALVALIFVSAPVAYANQMSFEIGSNLRGFNTAFVSVKVCEPHTGTCRIIDKIKLDTGSTGLRIKRSALGGLNLPVIKSKAGETLMACQYMAGQTGYVGPVAKADITLGDMTAANSNLQISEEGDKKRGIACRPFPVDGRNGILGIGSELVGRQGLSSFMCGKTNCRSYVPTDSEIAGNPIQQFDHDNNGFIVKTPSLSAPTNSMTGLVVFGIGTEDNNTVKPKLTKCDLPKNGFMLIDYKGKQHWTKFDSGTFSYLLPASQTDMKECAGGGGYLCPKNKSAPVSVAIHDRENKICASFDLPVKGYHTGDETTGRHHWVLPNLTTTDQRAPDILILGLPIFFGRDIYYGLEGRSSPLGLGPIVAF